MEECDIHVGAAFRVASLPIVQYRRVTHRVEQSTVRNPQVELQGDAHLVLTGPFYAGGDPHDPPVPRVVPSGGDLDGVGCLLGRPISLAPLMQGTLTFQQPYVDVLTSFVGDQSWCDDLRAALGERPDLPGGLRLVAVEVIGLLFPDGYGAVAVTIRVAGGWEPECRGSLMAMLAPACRDGLVGELRSMLLEPLERLLQRCGGGEAVKAELPYFNLTYAGHTDHPSPGRAVLDDEMRQLVFPDSPYPLASGSPLREEFFYPGYAFNVLAAADPVASLEKLTLLLLILDVHYVRLARNADAARSALELGDIGPDLQRLTRIEQRLRSEYQSLLAPTFSFDHHALMLRDSILHAWQLDRLQSLTNSLISMLRETIERTMAAEQARRTHRINVVVTVLTVLSAVATIEASVSLYDYLAS